MKTKTEWPSIAITALLLTYLFPIIIAHINLDRVEQSLKHLKHSHYIPSASINKNINHENNEHESELNTHDTSEYTTTIYSSCNDIKKDGLYYIKPIPDLPVLPVICSNGYTMLDASLDINLKTLPFFLSSWDYPRLNTYYILSRLDDENTFREWYLPSDENTKFNIAP
eukprot:878687_1